MPYNLLFDAATGEMKPLDDLRAAFTGAGVKLDAPIVTSCGSGVSAGVLTLALYRLGITDTALYDGSAEADISTEVTFEDGRKGMISARVKIRDLKVEPVKAALERAA